MIECIVFIDIGFYVNFLLLLDLLFCDIDDYDCNSDGFIELDFVIEDFVVLG